MKIINRKAKFKYKLLEDFEAGIQLMAGEVKSVRDNLVDLSNSYAKIIDNEIYLINANIPANGIKDPARSRKLLLHKDEIISIGHKIKTKKLTIVPTKLYTKGRLIKVKLALGKAKKEYQKKESIKKRDIERELQEALKSEARNTKF